MMPNTSHTFSYNLLSPTLIAYDLPLMRHANHFTLPILIAINQGASSLCHLWISYLTGDKFPLVFRLTTTNLTLFIELKHMIYSSSTLQSHYLPVETWMCKFNTI